MSMHFMDLDMQFSQLETEIRAGTDQVTNFPWSAKHASRIGVNRNL